MINNRIIEIGIEEENVLRSLFNDEEYLAKNPDVAAAGIDPFQHFINFGYQEGRNISDNFDSDYYLTRNPDVAAAGIDPLEHYVTLLLALMREDWHKMIFRLKLYMDLVQKISHQR